MLMSSEISENALTATKAQIWVDADSCPVVVRDILCRAAVRTQTSCTFIANQAIKLPPSPFLKRMQVEQGFDVADNLIVQKAQSGDLVISSDIPLADEVIQKGALVISFRGEQLNAANIKAKLNVRDFMETLRSSGIQSGGQSAFGQADKQQFANQLDRWLAKQR